MRVGVVWTQCGSGCSSTEVTLALSSHIPSPSLPPNMDHLQYAKCKQSKTGGGERTGNTAKLSVLPVIDCF